MDPKKVVPEKKVAKEVFIAASKEDVEDAKEEIIGVMQELVKGFAELTKENIKWYRAGKMSISMFLTVSALGSILLA